MGQPLLTALLHLITDNQMVDIDPISKFVGAAEQALKDIKKEVKGIRVEVKSVHLRIDNHMIHEEAENKTFSERIANVEADMVTIKFWARLASAVGAVLVALLMPFYGKLVNQLWDSWTGGRQLSMIEISFASDESFL